MVVKKVSMAKDKLKFARNVLAPVKVLLRGARDFYTDTFCVCAARIGDGSAMMTGFLVLPQVYPVPGNYSRTSLTKEIQNTKKPLEVIKEMTTRNVDGGWRKSCTTAESGSCGRSYSIGVGRIGRIDEDGPCDFLENNGSNKNMDSITYASQ